MKYIDSDDTIIALSTPTGRGALAVLRLSGPECLTVLNQLFSRKLSGRDRRQATMGKLYFSKSGELIDQVVATFYKAPNSYTGDDLVEISCHNNRLIIEKIMAAFTQRGVRIARPGEFTRRAFFNGKMDLTQAEAVAAVIDSKTRRSLSVSMRQLEGKLSERIREIKNQILDIASLVEVSLDFNEDDVQIYDKKELMLQSRRVRTQIDQIIQTFHYGRLLKEGIKLLILGKPNVGKSSLLNILLEKERAIVSEIPGTTRDYIEGYTQLDGVPVQLVDTAGIRHTLDTIEEKGVQRALHHAESSDIILAIFEGHRPLDDDDRRFFNFLHSLRNKQPVVVVVNKSDLGSDPDVSDKLATLGYSMIRVSAKRQFNIEELKQCIRKILLAGEEVDEEDVVITNARHQQALDRTSRELEQLESGLRRDDPEVILAGQIRSALDYLAEISGEITNEDLLNHIFGRFCIGK